MPRYKAIVVVCERDWKCGLENLKEEVVVVNRVERESTGFGDILTVRA